MRVKNVKIKLNLKGLEGASKRALYLTCDAIRSDIVARGVVPKDTGELERSGFVQVKNLIASVIYDTPYARRWYYNLDNAKFQRSTAIDHWMDFYLDGEGKRWVIDTYLKFLKQESGGSIK